MLRFFLALNVLVWLPYGLWCLFQPGYLTEAAGLALGTATATTEVRAMYGGLQAAIGCFALAALFRTDLERPVLLSIGFLAGGLLLGRLAGVLTDGGVSAYTAGALAFEAVLSGSALALLSRSAAAPAQRAETSTG